MSRGEREGKREFTTEFAEGTEKEKRRCFSSRKNWRLNLMRFEGEPGFRASCCDPEEMSRVRWRAFWNPGSESVRSTKTRSQPETERVFALAHRPNAQRIEGN